MEKRQDITTPQGSAATNIHSSINAATSAKHTLASSSSPPSFSILSPHDLKIPGRIYLVSSPNPPQLPKMMRGLFPHGFSSMRHNRCWRSRSRSSSNAIFHLNEIEQGLKKERHNITNSIDTFDRDNQGQYRANPSRYHISSNINNSTGRSSTAQEEDTNKWRPTTSLMMMMMTTVSEGVKQLTRRIKQHYSLWSGKKTTHSCAKQTIMEENLHNELRRRQRITRQQQQQQQRQQHVRMATSLDVRKLVILPHAILDHMPLAYEKALSQSLQQQH